MKRNWILLLISVFLCSVALEVFLQLVTRFPINNTSNTIPHSELLYVIDPSLREIDKVGFRNAVPPDRQAIFAIGDSHTYGNNVNSDHSWPQQLGHRLGLGVYNFGVGSYNIYQYYRLFEMALTYHPKYVVVGFYPANDLGLGVCKVLGLPYWKERMVQLGLENAYCPHLKGNEEPDRPGDEVDESLLHRLQEFFRLDTAIGNIIYMYVYKRLKKTGENSPGYIRLSNDAADLEPDAERLAEHSRDTDLGQGLVAESVENSKILYQRMQTMAAQQGVTLMIMIVPSKERVVATWADGQGMDLPGLLRRAYENESRLARMYLKFFSQSGILAADATPAMSALLDGDLEAGVNTYLPDDDHPLEPGYLAYAKTVQQLFPGN
jgi:hypothetical protein